MPEKEFTAIKYSVCRKTGTVFFHSDTVRLMLQAAGATKKEIKQYDYLVDNIYLDYQIKTGFEDFEEEENAE